MSYDLFFTEPDITIEEFNAYFSGRNHYRAEKAQAWYENEDTGVYFCFDYETESEKDPEGPKGNVTFNLNFYRPHYFALEAEPEVQSVVDHFGFRIYDPQTHGMDDGPYSRDGFIAGWNHGNEFGYRAIIDSEEPPEIILTRPREELDAIWRWNYSKEQTQSRLGDGVFVPRIMFIQIQGEVQSMVVWPDAIPTLIPRVDGIVIPRQEFAPRRLLKKTDDTCTVPFGEALPLLEAFESTEYCMPAYLLSYVRPPGQLVDFVRALSPQEADMQGIPMDQVLDRELVEQYRKG